jgi:hypothetical protein
MAEVKTWSGGCHCGKVRYQVSTDLAQVLSCNCSICTKHGLLVSPVPAEAFKLLSGQDQVREYQFGKKRIRHQFCTTCGVESFAHGSMPDGTPIVAINVRCLEGIDLNALTLTPFDGRSM